MPASSPWEEIEHQLVPAWLPLAAEGLAMPREQLQRHLNDLLPWQWQQVQTMGATAFGAEDLQRVIRSLPSAETYGSWSTWQQAAEALPLTLWNERAGNLQATLQQHLALTPAQAWGLLTGSMLLVLRGLASALSAQPELGPLMVALQSAAPAATSPLTPALQAAQAADEPLAPIVDAPPALSSPKPLRLARFYPLLLGLGGALLLLWLLSKSCNRQPAGAAQSSAIAEEPVVAAAEARRAKLQQAQRPELRAAAAVLDQAPTAVGSLADQLRNFLLSGEPAYQNEVFTALHGQFAPGQATVSPPLVAEIRQLQPLFQALPQLQIALGVHTDPSADPQSDQALTQQRAEALRQILVATGIDPSRILVQGYGAALPLLPNDTPTNRQLNQRVELTLIQL